MFTDVPRNRRSVPVPIWELTSPSLSWFLAFIPLLSKPGANFRGRHCSGHHFCGHPIFDIDLEQGFVFFCYMSLLDRVLIFCARFLTDRTVHEV